MSTIRLRDGHPAITPTWRSVAPRPLAAAVYDDSHAAGPLDAALPAQVDDPLLIADIAGATVVSPWCYLLVEDALVVESIERGRQSDLIPARWPEVLRLARAASHEDGRVALIGSQRLNGYWHWWADVVPRMWLLKDKPVPFLLPPLQHEWQTETLRLLGWTDRVVTIEPGARRYSTVAFTQGVTAFRSRYPSSEVAAFARWLRNALQVPASSRERIYVRRPPGMSRGVTNESEVLAYLESEGFRCVDAGTWPLREQVDLFASAEIVVGPHGGGLTNILFSAPGTPVVELFSTDAAQGASCYRVLASRLEQPYARVVCDVGRRGRREVAHDDELVVDLKRLDKALRVATRSGRTG